MKPLKKVLFAVAGLTVLCLAALQSAEAQQPLYNNVKPKTRFRLNDVKSVILLPPKASSVDDAKRTFDARAAAAIYQATGGDLLNLQGQDYGVAILACYAYADYIDDGGFGTGKLERALVSSSLPFRKAGQIGSVDPGDYDMLLNLYVAIVYKYYSELPVVDREHIINDLLTVRGPLGTHESECENCSSIATIPETENHLFMIETARYLTNQLLYQRTHLPQFDNRRNGHGNDPQDTAVWLLDQLRGRLMNDFDEYNARPYQDQIMMAMLNLASYAYDYDVRLAARMVLDYISAKVAVSSSDLRRAPPFRRRNEDQHWGPNIPGSFFLRSPLLKAKADYPDRPGIFEPDPQGAWYALLAGNTELLGTSAPGTPGPGNFGFAMVLGGTHDYRIPDPILDLFINGANRRFYQRFHHTHTTRDSGVVGVADELYAGSPSYLITAGGHPTGRVYEGHVGPIFSGKTSDLGSAMPTTFMPTGSGLTLESMIQFGQYTDSITDNGQVKHHMCVAPDFACGAGVYPTAEINNADPNDPTIVKQGPWTFVNRGHSGEQRPGYYLALYDGFIFGDFFGLLEAYDTWLHPGLSFVDFKRNVLAAHGSARFSGSGTNTYVTQSGQRILFTISPLSDIVSTTDEPEPAGYKEKFTHGTILDSQQGSGIIVIRNPALGTQITLKTPDKFHFTRVSESGEVERAGFDVHEEVWLDFDSPVPSDPAGDFYHPFKTLADAQKAVAVGGTIKIVPGSSNERVRLDRKMTLKSFPGSATIGRQ
jgi:hypothetical protein